MKKMFVVFMLMELGFVCAANAQTPDPNRSTVAPWDSFNKAYVCPGSGGDAVTVTVADASGSPLPGINVQIDFSGCSAMCIDTPSGLMGTTDASGVVVLDPRVGGSQICPVNIIAGGVILRTYPLVTSSDWDGGWADGVVGPLDRQFFQSHWPPNPYHPLADHDGDATIGLNDLSMINACTGNSNGTICPNPSCMLNCPGLDGGPTGGSGPGNRSPDINSDALINLVDLSLFARAWPPGSYNNCADYNCDGVINLVDLSQFAAHFGHNGNVPGVCY